MGQPIFNVANRVHSGRQLFRSKRGAAFPQNLRAKSEATVAGKASAANTTVLPSVTITNIITIAIIIIEARQSLKYDTEN